MEWAVLGVNMGHPVVTCGAVIIFREGWRSGFPKITLRLLVSTSIAQQSEMGVLSRIFWFVRVRLSTR